MRDKWMNSGCNEEELKPYVEPEHCMDDPRRIEQLVALGYAPADIEDSLLHRNFDDIYATYLLMGRRAADVSAVLGHTTHETGQYTTPGTPRDTQLTR